MDRCSKDAQFLANVILVYLSIPPYMELYTWLANILTIVLTLGTAHRILDAARDIIKRVFPIDPLFPENLPENTRLALDVLGPRDGFIVMVSTAQKSRRFYVAHAALCLAMTNLFDAVWTAETFRNEKDYFYNTSPETIRNKLYRLRELQTMSQNRARALQTISQDSTRLNLVENIKSSHYDRVRNRVVRDERRKRMLRLGPFASTIDIELEKEYMASRRLKTSER